MSGFDLLPPEIRNLYEVHEWRKACAVLHSAHPDEWTDILDVLKGFELWEKLRQFDHPREQTVASA